MKQWNYLEILKVVTKDENLENVSRLEISETVLVHGNAANSDYQ